MSEQPKTLAELCRHKILEEVHYNRATSVDMVSQNNGDSDHYVELLSSCDNDSFKLSLLEGMVPLYELNKLINERIYSDTLFKAFDMNEISTRIGVQYEHWYIMMRWCQFYIENVEPIFYEYRYNIPQVCIQKHADPQQNQSAKYVVILKRLHMRDQQWLGLFHFDADGFESHGELVSTPGDMYRKVSQRGYEFYFSIIIR